MNTRPLARKRMLRAGADKHRVAFGQTVRYAVALVRDFARGNIKELKKLMRMFVFVLRCGQLRCKRQG